MNESTLISCLCITRQRVPLLRRALACFQQQTHSHRECVIVCENDDDETIQYLQRCCRADSRIRPVVVAAFPKLPLGTLRNIAVEASAGEFVCQWDDDDWYRYDRLSAQLAALQRASTPGCVLSRWILFNSHSQQGYWSQHRIWEGSVMCEKAEMEPYPPLARGEDTPMIETLHSQGKLTMLDQPELYVYIFHGNNTWNDRRWRRKFRRGHPLTPDLNRMVADAIRIE